MGNFCGKQFEEDVEVEYDTEHIRLHLLMVLREEGPAELLNYATKDDQNYEICKNDEVLRKACMLAASRRYYFEKFRYEEVCNKTAPYVRLLEDFIQLQNSIDEQKRVEEDRFDCGSSVRRLIQQQSERKRGRAMSF
ncbi:uncharacterized protein LOC107398715 [Tribolium castaneum]|uniref:uncharacterized protein LOC107398715 n=1 Tax=Tribolium castaneum TaxID=7070 RepID=UPI0001DCC89E|nr:PREDICTED: uncharacterized protein LOC107398715 [Tribolium castaneum]|eukprot:XP_015839354.1 PREDICTED: uncharacterized protein LOC107398715 [Tribolium castaneum]